MPAAWNSVSLMRCSERVGRRMGMLKGDQEVARSEGACALTQGRHVELRAWMRGDQIACVEHTLSGFEYLVLFI